MGGVPFLIFSSSVMIRLSFCSSALSVSSSTSSCRTEHSYHSLQCPTGQAIIPAVSGNTEHLLLSYMACLSQLAACHQLPSPAEGTIMRRERGREGTFRYLIIFHLEPESTHPHWSGRGSQFASRSANGLVASRWFQYLATTSAENNIYTCTPIISI